MEHEASLSRHAREEKLSLQQMIKDITQVLVSPLLKVTRLGLAPPRPPGALSGAQISTLWGVQTWGLMGMISLSASEARNLLGG